MVNGDNQNVNVGLIQRLFDQLEKAMGKIDDGMSNVSIVIADMIEILKHSATNEEIISALAKHSIKVTPTIDIVKNIYGKCESHGNEIQSINKHINKLTGWVKWMITIIGVVFTLMTATYLFTSNSINMMVKNEVSKVGIAEHQNTKVNLEMQSLMKEVKDLRKELKKYEGMH